MKPIWRRLLALTVLIVPLAAACTDNGSGSATSGSSSGSTQLTVTSTATECKLSATEAPSGNVVFTIKNNGDKVTEFYLYAKDGTTIAGEVENIGPGVSRRLVLRAKAGSYVTACKPGQTGDGIRGTFTVTGSGGGSAAPNAELSSLETAATDQYRAYVQQQAGRLLSGTVAFAEAYKAGNDDQARALYAPTRVYWESIEPVAEAFGDIDPKLDYREADVEAGQTLTGWHQIEKQLWPPVGAQVDTPAQRAQMADGLVADTQDLVNRVKDQTYRADQLSNGSKELLDEVAATKVTGEEEIWSGTDLWDFQANFDGARKAYESLRPVVLVKDPALAKTLDERFAATQSELDKHKVAGGFKNYNELTPVQVKALSNSVNAVGEPLSKLTSVVVL